MRKLQAFFVIAASLLLSACSFSEMAAKILPDEVEVQMEQVIDLVVAQDKDAIKALGTEEFQSLENLDEGFNSIFEQQFPEPAFETKLVNANINYQNSLGSEPLKVYSAQYERIFKDGVNLYTVVIVKEGDDSCCALYSVNLKKFDVSPSVASAFTFKNKGAKHYLVLALAVLVPVFIIFTLVKCVRTKGLRRKWLWIIFILFGFWGIAFNWMTGELGMSLIEATEKGTTINIIDFKLLGASIEKIGPYAPWFIEVGVPLGAILFWFKARKLRRETVEIFESKDPS